MDKATKDRLTAMALMGGSLKRADDGLAAAFDTALSLVGNKHYSSLVYASLRLVKDMQDGIVAELRSEIPCGSCYDGSVELESGEVRACGICNGTRYDLGILDR